MSTAVSGYTPDTADLDYATIYHLKQTGWTLTQIAAFVGRDRVEIARLLREAQGAQPHTAVVPLTIRLTRDARRLQIVLPADGLPTPTAVLLEQIRAHCTRQRIDLALTLAEFEARLRTCVYGSWLTIREALRPTPPVPERIHLVVPVQVTSRRRRSKDPAASVVRAGTVLAQREPGLPGQPGRDLLGREIPPRQPRPAHLPQGQNTHISADGRQLIAACEGRVVLQQLRLHVIPTTLHEGDLTAADGVLRAAGDVIVTGSVCADATLMADGDITIQGYVHSATVTTTGGGITVGGAVSGAAHRPSMLRTARTITCERAIHAILQAGGDIVIRSDVHHCTLEPTRHLVLSQALERTLFDVRLAVGGGVIVPVAPLVPPPAAPTERRYTRVALTVPAQLAVYGPPPLTFRPCVIEDLGPGGARCQLRAPLAAEQVGPETVVQLKLVLPGHADQVIVLARVIHVVSPDNIGVAFVQISERHADQVMQAYLQGLQDPANHKRGIRADRLRTDQHSDPKRAA